MRLHNPFRHRHKDYQVHLYTDKSAYFTGWCPCRPLDASTFGGSASVKVFTNAQRGPDGKPPGMDHPFTPTTKENDR